MNKVIATIASLGLLATGLVLTDSIKTMPAVMAAKPQELTSSQDVPMVTGSIFTPGMLDIPSYDGIWEYWLHDYEGGLNFTEFEEAVKPGINPTSSKDTIKEILENRKITFLKDNYRIWLRNTLSMETSPYISHLELSTESTSLDLYVTYHLRNNSTQHRKIQWDERFTDETVCRTNIEQGMTMIMKALARNGVWV